MGTEEQSSNGGGVATGSDTLTITDNRTGETYDVEITDDTVRAMDLRQIKVAERFGEFKRLTHFEAQQA